MLVMNQHHHQHHHQHPFLPFHPSSVSPMGEHSNPPPPPTAPSSLSLSAPKSPSFSSSSSSSSSSLPSSSSSSPSLSFYQQSHLPASTPDPNPPSSSSKIPFRPGKIRKTASNSSSPSSASHIYDQKQQDTLTQQEDSKPPLLPQPNPHHQLIVRIPPPLPRSLSSDGELDAAIRHLRAADPILARVIDCNDPPVFQSLHPPFHSLARSILYQQLAMKAAASIYTRFLALCGGEPNVLPEVVLSLSAHQLRQIGISARKASYLHDLASKYRNGILSDESIVAMDDKSLFSMLTMVEGIGAWSVHMFMIFSLHRPDVLPVGDLGVRKGVQILYGLNDVPRPSQMEQLCEKWRPYRSVGSWYMWRLLEQKSPPAASVAGQQQQQQQHQQQLLGPINGIADLG